MLYIEAVHHYCHYDPSAFSNPPSLLSCFDDSDDSDLGGDDGDCVGCYGFV